MQTSIIGPVEADQAQADVQKLYQSIQSKMHMVPNIFKYMGNSGTALQGFLALSEAANQAKLPGKLKEKIALTVGQANGCQYCLAAHTMLAKFSGIADAEIMKARNASAEDGKEQAILNFTKQVVEKKAHIDDADRTALIKAGVTEHEFVDIILVIMVNMFTNYFNLIANTKIDFPQAPALTKN